MRFDYTEVLLRAARLVRVRRKVGRSLSAGESCEAALPRLSMLLPWHVTLACHGISALCPVPGRRQSQGNTASLIPNCPSWLATDDSRINEGQQRGIGNCQIWVPAPAPALGPGPLTFLWLWDASKGGAVGRRPKAPGSLLAAVFHGHFPSKVHGGSQAPAASFPELPSRLLEPGL